VNKIKPLIQLNPYFKLRPTYSCSSLNKSVDYNLYGLIKHFSQRKTLINNMKRFTHKLLLPIAISSLLVGNVTAQSVYPFADAYSHSEVDFYPFGDISSHPEVDFYPFGDAYSQSEVDFYPFGDAYSFDPLADVTSEDDSSDTKKGPYAVDLGRAGSFSILSKSGITDVYRSAIVGDVGTSPITGAALLLTCEEVDGAIYTVDAAGPYPCAKSNASNLTVAVSHMEAAYVDAAGRSSPDFIELGAGEIGGLTLEPGLYKWSSGVTISTDVTFSGGPDDVWILQIAGTMNEAVSTKVTLAGGALASNIFWQVAEATTIGSYAHFEGVILSKTMIAVNTGASVNGRLLAQTAVTLQMNTITAPSE
jgi:hypothetical protein